MGARPGVVVESRVGERDRAADEGGTERVIAALADQLVRLRIHGVSPDDARRVNIALGKR